VQTLCWQFLLPYPPHASSWLHMLRLKLREGKDLSKVPWHVGRCSWLLSQVWATLAAHPTWTHGSQGAFA
jgi:hypothetical protein